MNSIVYFFRRADGDIKIGTVLTRRLKIREKELTAKYGKLDFLGYIEGDGVVERKLHYKFESHRRYTRRITTSKRGAKFNLTEFFAPHEELLEFIERHATKTMPKDIKASQNALPLTPTNHNRMRQFRNGLTAVVTDASFDDAIALLLDLAIKPGEDDLDAGRRLAKRLQELKRGED